jgi:replicative superfamily II helicase
LTRPVRRLIEEAFRRRLLRLLTATPTLAAGVNLPAGVVVVRDIFRGEVVRGTYRRVALPPGELLNMLGRAARPGLVQQGIGVLLVEEGYLHNSAVKRVLESVRSRRGGIVTSRLLESFDGLMRFVLSVVVERGEATQDDIARAFAHTFAHHRRPQHLRFDRPFEEDLMEDIPAYRRAVAAGGTIGLERAWLLPGGIQATVLSGENRYQVTLASSGLACTCPAAQRYYRDEICKHQAYTIHELVFRSADEETRQRAIYVCGHLFANTLDAGTLLARALDLLTAWRLVEPVPAGWRATPVGEVAASSGFDLLLVHEAIGRVSQASEADYWEVARWAVVDYFTDEPEEQRWLRAIAEWLDEVPEHEMKLPVRYRGEFEERLEELARVCLLYERAALALGRPALAKEARIAAGALRYGVAPELVPLMALGFPQLGRARCRYLYQRGIRDVEGLAAADPTALADPRRAPEALVRRWVERARELYQARAIALADRQEADVEFDELVARFRVGPEAIPR